MPLPKSKLPPLFHRPAYLAARLALAAVGVTDPYACSDAGARLGRLFGSLPMNRNRLARATGNLRIAFPDWDDHRILDCALESYAHLFRLAAELIHSPLMLTDDAWSRHLHLGNLQPAVRTLLGAQPCLLITGHCGNWEMLGYTLALLGFPVHALYRPLDLPPLDRWVRTTRERRGLKPVDKFGAIRELPALVAAGAPIGVVADQNGGDRGVFVPFFNRLASTYKSIGLLALQFNARVICGVARRRDPGEPPSMGPTEGPLGDTHSGLGYQIELTDAFGPEDWSTHPDPLFYLTARYRRAIELMVRRAPEQYLWVHRIWRSRPRHERLARPFPEALEEKIRLLPWISDADVELMKEHSRRDAATLAATGQTRLS